MSCFLLFLALSLFFLVKRSNIVDGMIHLFSNKRTLDFRSLFFQWQSIWIFDSSPKQEKTLLLLLFFFLDIIFLYLWIWKQNVFFLSWFQLHRCLFLASAFEVAAKVGHPSRKIQFKHSSSMIYSCKYHEFRWVSSDFAYSIVGPPSICSASFGNVVVVHK